MSKTPRGGPTTTPRGRPISATMGAALGNNTQKFNAQQPGGTAGTAVSSASATVNAKDKQFRVDSDVRTMVVSGHTVWLAHNDGSLTVRKTRTAEIAHHFAAGTGRVWALLAVSVGGSDYVWVGLSTGDIEIYNSMTREFVKKLSRHTGGIYCFAEFNGQIYTGSNDFEIMQWDANEMVFVRQLTGHTNYVRCLYAEGSALFSGSDDHTVRVWNATNGQNLNTAKFHSTGVSAICRVGMHMWSGDDSGKIAVWRLQTLEHEETLHEHLGRINVIKKVGSRVYAGSADHDISVWDAYTREQVTRINDHRGWVMNLACPAQLARYYLWSAAADGTVRCWHHDEYRVMGPDQERFDDARWYNSEFTPYKELNCNLTKQVATLEQRCDLLQREYTSKNMQLAEHTNMLNNTQSTVKNWQEEVDGARLHVKEVDRTNAELRAVLAQKEKEMSDLTLKLKIYQSENVDLRCANERQKLDNEEMRRRLDLSEKERSKLDVALRETLGSRNDGRNPVPCIIATETQAQEAITAMQKQLTDAIQMNQMLILDMNRYKGILGLAPTPMPKQISMGSEGATAIGGSPTKRQLNLATEALAAEQHSRLVSAANTVSGVGSPQKPGARAASASPSRPTSSAATTASSSAGTPRPNTGAAPQPTTPQNSQAILGNVPGSGLPANSTTPRPTATTNMAAPVSSVAAASPNAPVYTVTSTTSNNVVTAATPVTNIGGTSPVPAVTTLAQQAQLIGAATTQQQHQPPPAVLSNVAQQEAAIIRQGVSQGEGYTDRGNKWSSDVRSYVQDRYFSKQPFGQQKAKAPRAPSGRPQSARRAY